MKKKRKDSPKTYAGRYSVAQNVWYCARNTAQGYALLLCWCGLSVGVQTALPILSAYLPKTVIDGIVGGNGPGELVAAVLGLMGCIALLSGAGDFLTKYIYHQKFRMNTLYLKRVAMKGLTTDYANQENETFRKLQAESFACCNGNYSPLTNIYDICISLCTSVLGLWAFGAILFQVNGLILVFLFVTALMSFLLNRRVTQWLDRHHPERIGYEQRLNYISRTAGDSRAAKDIRLYRMAVWFSNLYDGNMRGLADWYRCLTRRVFGVAVGDGGLALLREGITYAYLMFLVWRQRIAIADFVLYVGVVTGFSAWLSNLFAQLSQLNTLNLKINCFRAYLEYPEKSRRNEGRLPMACVPGVIELRHVSYRYEGAEQFALRDLDLKIEAGEHVAVVGLNGAGKTTLVKLICGLIDPTEGQVLYDGVDIREYNRVAFYELFAAVFQQFSLLPVTIEEMVAEAPGETLQVDRVRQCLQAAGLWERVARLPRGVKSQLGKTIYEDGVELSGGEVQKLLLARALYKSGPVLLLDEPTAALDPIAESNLYANYHRISAGKTTVFVSHRLASTSFCDRILLMENGAVCEEGTHADLIRRNGTYARLFAMQAKYYLEKDLGKEAETCAR